MFERILYTIGFESLGATEAKTGLLSLWSSQMQEFKTFLVTLVLALFTLIEGLSALNVQEPMLSAVIYVSLGFVVAGGIFSLARSMWYNALTHGVIVTPVEVSVGADPFTRVQEDVIAVVRSETRIRKPNKTLGGKGPERSLGYRILVRLGDTQNVDHGPSSWMRSQQQE